MTTCYNTLDLIFAAPSFLTFCMFLGPEIEQKKLHLNGSCWREEEMHSYTRFCQCWFCKFICLDMKKLISKNISSRYLPKSYRKFDKKAGNKLSCTRDCYKLYKIEKLTFIDHITFPIWPV